MKRKVVKGKSIRITRPLDDLRSVHVSRMVDGSAWLLGGTTGDFTEQIALSNDAFEALIALAIDVHNSIAQQAEAAG